MSTLTDGRRRTTHTGLVPSASRAHGTGTYVDPDTLLDANLAATVATFAADLADGLDAAVRDVKIRSAQAVDKILVHVRTGARGAVETFDLGWVTEPVAPADIGDSAAEPALRRTAELIGLPLRDTCIAAGIAWRTFQSWTPATRPRVASQGRLWQLVHLAQNLDTLLDGAAAQWIAANPDVRTMIMEGRFEDAMNVLLSDRARRGTYRDAAADTVTAGAGSEATLDLLPRETTPQNPAAGRTRRGGGRRPQSGDTHAR